ncbi:MAG: SusC/RagA family TonB-linked outer membrane protein [Bacteroidota bacterium]
MHIQFLSVRPIIALVLLLYLSSNALAQQTVTGRVIDVEGEALPAATVAIKESNRGTTTDLDGYFSLKVEAEDEMLQISYVGYPTIDVELDGRENLGDILMNSSTIITYGDVPLGRRQGPTVVVTALGINRKNEELGYAVQSVNSRELTDVQSANFLDNLAGQLAGVTITAGPTGVGSTSLVTIRGSSSFTNNNPLFVVDGIPVNNSTIVNVTNEQAAGFQEVDFGNGAMDINPNDVESVTVLKGPSAAALYGTRAANGAIVITTKTGASPEGNLGISFSSSTFLERPFQLPQYQNTFGQGNNGEFEFVDGLGGGVNDNITYSYGPRMGDGIFIPQYDSPVTLPDGRVVRGGDVAVHGGLPITPTRFVARPDNVRNFYETGLTSINNLAFSGRIGDGGQGGNFRLSATDLRSDSYIPGVNLKRKTLAARLNLNPTERISINLGLNYINSNSDNRPAGGYGSENINYDLTAWLGRQTDLEPLRDYWQPGLEGVQQYSFNYTFFDNPYLILLENRNSFNRDRLFGFLSASYRFDQYLSLTIRSGMDYSDEQRQFRRAFSTNRFSNGGYAENDIGYREINTDFLLRYERRFGTVGFELSAGGNRLDQFATNQQAQAVTLAQPGIFKLSNAASPVQVFDLEARKRINSLYGLLKLSLNNWIYLDVTGRNDWSSALATPASVDGTSFFYPSASLSLVLSNQLRLPSAISFAQLRASWAQVGNDTDPYRTGGTFVAQTPVNGQPTFSDQFTLANETLLPEQVTSIEFGADLRFAEDRLGLDVTYFNQLAANQIISLPIAISSGYTQQVVNGGEVRTQGLEAVLSWRTRYREKFGYRAAVNFSTFRSRVESLPAGADRLTLAYSRVYDNPNQSVYFIVEEGSELGDLWGTGYLRNEDGEFIINEDGRLIADNELKKLGNANPDFILGFNNEVRFGRVRLAFLLDWRQGGQLVSRTLSLAGVGGQLEETEFRPDEGLVFPGVVNVGTDENPRFEPNTTAIPAETYYRQFYDRNHEENNIYDASYLKLRELRISYDFGDGSLSSGVLSAFSNLRVSLIGRNLYAWSAIPHFDPEQFAIQGQTFVGGVEDMTYPSARSFGISLEGNF